MEALSQTHASYVGDKLVKVASTTQKYRVCQNQMGIFGAHGTSVALCSWGQYTVDHRTIGNQKGKK